MEQYGCVLLKGGKSSRMGGSDKAKLLYRGKSFEERIKGELEQLGLPVFVSEAKKSPDPRAIPDLIPEAGPLGGIYSCLKQTGLDGLFFVSCDMPLFASYLGKRALMEETGGFIQCAAGIQPDVCRFLKNNFWKKMGKYVIC